MSNYSLDPRWEIYLKEDREQQDNTISDKNGIASFCRMLRLF